VGLELRGFKQTEELNRRPTTNDRTALAEMLEKASDGDLLREMSPSWRSG
jgi:hypothetical protein